MPKNRHRDILEKTLLAAAALFLLVGIIALGFLQSLSKENRALVVIVTSFGVIVCFASLIMIDAFWRWLRKRIWRRAMSAWRESVHAGNAPRFFLDCEISEAKLRNLAIQAYSRIGYLIRRDGGVAIIRLVNPEGRVELVICKRHTEPADIRSIHALYREMKKTEAVRGFFWSPSGFASEAIHWARQMPIVLVDPIEIGRLVDCAQESGSPLLET